MPRLVPIPKVTRLKRPGNLDRITVECPSCHGGLVCNQTADDKRRNQHSAIHIHPCPAIGEDIYFLNISIPGSEYALYGAAEYNTSEKSQNPANK